MIDPHERLPTGIDWSKPTPDPHALSHLQPGWDEIPERFQKLGMRLERMPERRRRVKDGLDALQVGNHLGEISQSYGYALEHKLASLWYLTDLWCEEVEGDAEEAQ